MTSIHQTYGLRYLISLVMDYSSAGLTRWRNPLSVGLAHGCYLSLLNGPVQLVA
jgi:hypothetical protein